MSEIAFPSTYNEPTVIWRMRHADGRSAQAVIDPMNGATRVLWVVNDQPLDVRYFADWTGAIEWSDRLRAQQWTVGWRLSDEITEDPQDAIKTTRQSFNRFEPDGRGIAEPPEDDHLGES